MGLLAVPASAAEVDSGVYFNWYSYQGGYNPSLSQFFLNSPTTSASSQTGISGTSSGYTYFVYPDSIFPNSRTEKYGAVVTLYISFFFLANGGTSTLYRNPIYTSSDFSGRYLSGSTGAYVDIPVTVDTFKPNITYSASAGYTLSARAPGSEAESVSLPDIDFLPGDDKPIAFTVVNGSPNIQLMVTSVRYVTTETTADSEALEDMADQISQQTELMQSFYGDIVSILQAMDTKLGSLEAAADLMNTYLSQVVSSLGSLNSTASNIYTLLGTYLHYLETISQTAEDIKSELASFHTDFLTYIQLLISTVSSESDDIQAKMEEIYKLLIQYLNTAFAGAVTDEVTEGIQGADNQLDAIEGIESNYTGSLSDKWQSIGISDFTIAPGLLSGVAWVSSWWSNLFEATGDFKVILTLALFFGVCGLLIGMISRASRRAGGGDGDA